MAGGPFFFFISRTYAVLIGMWRPVTYCGEGLHGLRHVDLRLARLRRPVTEFNGGLYGLRHVDLRLCVGTSRSGNCVENLRRVEWQLSLWKTQ